MPKTQEKTLSKSQYQNLLNDIQNLISQGLEKTKEEGNNAVILTYWQIGKRINEESLSTKSNYHNSVLKEISNELEIERSNLSRCLSFYQTYQTPPKQTNLSWSHYRHLIAIKDKKTRDALEKQAIKENWSKEKLLSAIKNLNNRVSKDGILQLNRPKMPSYIYKAKILEIIDGDTLLVDIDLGFQCHKEQRIRLAEIQAPELITKDGKTSFHHLRNKLGQISQIVIQTKKIDIYGRYLGHIFYNKNDEFKSIDDVFKNGIYLNQELLDDGVVVGF